MKNATPREIKAIEDRAEAEVFAELNRDRLDDAIQRDRETDWFLVQNAARTVRLAAGRLERYAAIRRHRAIGKRMERDD